MKYEALKNKSSRSNSAAGFRVCEKLHLHLATFMGSSGFRSLLSRSLALSTAEVPWLGQVHIQADWSLAGWEELEAQLGPDKMFEGGVVLVAHLLGLLVAFIGENLTLRLVREVWLKVPLTGLGFGGGTEPESK